MFNSLPPSELKHTRLLCPPLSPRVCSNSYPLSQWCYLFISSSTTPLSFCLQSFPTSGSFPVSWLFASGGQNTGASASASVLPMNIQGWFPLALIGLISLLSKRFSRVFSSTTVRKHQLLDPQLSLWSISMVEINFSQFWRIQSPISSHWQILCLVRIHCLIHRHHFLLYPHRAGETREFHEGVFHKSINPIHEGSALGT